MSKSIKIFALLVYLLTFVQSFSSFDSEKEPFNPIQTQFKSNELKEYTDTIEINVKSEDNQNLIVGYEGVLCLKAEFNKSQSDLFNPETIEEDTKFELDFTELTTEDKLKCRLWMTSERIYLFCDPHFDEGSHSIYFKDKSFEYKSQYLIKITFDNSITFEEAGTYSLTIKENTENRVNEITYDENEYEFTVEVVDEGKGQLEVKSDTSCDVIFTNKYNEPGKGGNPKPPVTYDGIMSSVMTLTISMIGLIGSVLFSRRCLTKKQICQK